MAAFLKNLARMLGSSAKEPSVYLAAFGKHPGWNDHIDDLGLDTDDLVTAKTLLYAQGINQNIDAGAWENLEHDKRLADFRHEFLWHMNGNGADGEDHSLIAGRMWSSVDGKGRDKYPMVLCAGTVSLPDSFAKPALKALAKTHERCAAATTADQIRKIMQEDRETLRASAENPPPAEPLDAKKIAAVANSRDLAPSREGFHRIVYQIARGMSAFRPVNGSGSASRAMSRRAEQIRVPLCGMSPGSALVFWLRFCLTLLDPSIPILLLAPDPLITVPAAVPPVPEPPPEDPNEESVVGPPPPPPEIHSWIDIIVGEPTAQNLFCIKAATKSLPFTSDIPYTLDRSFCQAVNRFVDDAAAPAGNPVPQWPAL